MTRPPLAYPLTRTTDGEAGGIADLQTDVMRFMAILAICLVAIFALVQSIPLESVAEPVPEPIAKAEIVVVTRPAPAPQPEPAPTTEPPAQTAAPAPEPAPAPAPAPAPVAQTGFTLQFENDLALTRLVARNDIGLFAMDGNESLRMNVDRGRFSFWPASTPNEFHEMDATTVPHEVATALQRARHDAATTMKWGVTLPADMQQRLDNLLQTGDGGAIYIAADGRLRLEN
jgi:hypothetical protein